MAQNINATLLTRLRQLVKNTPQAEIARKTESSRNNVSRYLRGTKMPLEFGVGLVKGLGVNPSWLLAGEGSAMLADVAAGTAKTAQDLLALVNAMQEVARMRLGSLAGKHHLKVLRELNEALALYETLRERLNKQTAPFFAELIDQYEHALLKSEADRARELRKALLQVSRLCDDPALTRQFVRAQAYEEHYFGVRQRAIELQRQVFRIDLTTPGAVTGRACYEAHNFALTLRGAGRMREARALCQAMHILGEQAKVQPHDSLLGLTLFEGSIDIALGDLQIGLPKVVCSFFGIPPKERETSLSVWLRAQLVSGSISYAQAIDMKTDPDMTASMLVSHALLTEHLSAMELAARDCLGGGGRVPVDAREAVLLRASIEVLRSGRDASKLGKLANERVEQAVAEARDARAVFYANVEGAQFARLCASKTLCAHRTFAAESALNSLPRDEDVEIWLRAVHARNQIEVSASKAESARALLADIAARGYAGISGPEP